MANRKQCCPMCSPAGLDFNPRKRVADAARTYGWAVQSVFTDNPYAIGFAYTVGLAERGQPELITFGQDPEELALVLNTVAEKTAGRTRWEKPFGMTPTAGNRVQLRPVLDRWRDVHACFAADYWKGQPFPLWQVRLPRTDGTFSKDGTCCTPPCQPLLDREDPWLPVEHALRVPATHTLWHRVVAPAGVWEGRWEKLGGLLVDDTRFLIGNVPFLADDLRLCDVVTVREEPSGRLIVNEVVEPSDYATVRIDGRPGDRQYEALEATVASLEDTAAALFEGTHWPFPYWVCGVPTERLSVVEDVLRPLRREGLVEYQIIRPQRVLAQ